MKKTFLKMVMLDVVSYFPIKSLKYLKTLLILSFIITFSFADKLSKPFVQMGHSGSVNAVAFNLNRLLV